MHHLKIRIIKLFVELNDDNRFVVQAKLKTAR